MRVRKWRTIFKTWWAQFLRIGWYYPDPGEHGGLAKPITAEQRAEWAKEGVAMIDATIKAADIKGIVQAMGPRQVHPGSGSAKVRQHFYQSNNPTKRIRSGDDKLLRNILGWFAVHNFDVPAANISARATARQIVF
jgi:hypothetical protein